MADDRAQLQTEAAVSGQQGIPGDLRSHLAVTQDEVRQDCEHRCTRGALDTADGEITQLDTDIMGVACQTPAAATGSRVFELKAKGQEKGEHNLEKRLAIVKQLEVRRMMLKIVGNGPVCSRRFGRCAHVSPLCHQVSSADATRWGSRVEISKPL